MHFERRGLFIEKKLRSLFDFQKYEGNPALQQVIDSVHARHSARELSLEELEWVAAAGTPDMKSEKKDEDVSHQF